MLINLASSYFLNFSAKGKYRTVVTLANLEQKPYYFTNIPVKVLRGGALARAFTVQSESILNLKHKYMEGNSKCIISGTINIIIPYWL